jgi:hypothetical protein
MQLSISIYYRFYIRFSSADQLLVLLNQRVDTPCLSRNSPTMNMLVERDAFSPLSLAQLLCVLAFLTSLHAGLVYTIPSLWGTMVTQICEGDLELQK